MFSVISLCWQGAGWDADVLVRPGRADPAALALSLHSKAILK